MKTLEFQKLLFHSAFSMMVIDGNIHENEKEELLSIVSNTPYFFDFEFENNFENNLSLVKREGKNSINNLLKEISNSDLNDKQELILIEVLLKMVDSDQEVNDNEIKFLHLIKSKLKINEETLILKFPKQIEYLLDFNKFGNLSSFDSDIKLN